MRRWDVFQLLPGWTFFAPNPGVHDHYLLYRDQTEHGAVGEWHQIQPSRPRGYLSAVWNPDKVESKVVDDLAQVFSTQHSADADDLTLMLSIPYLVWLKMAAAAPHDPDARLRQFVLARKRGLVPADDPEPIVVSSFHPL